MSKDVMEWIIGPQLIGVVFLLAGFIQKMYPPKKINSLYGYRTPAASQNQETWDEANRYSALFMLKAGSFLLIGGLLISYILITAPMPDKTRFVISYFIILASTMGIAISIMVSTEKHLEKTFGSKKQ